MRRTAIFLSLFVFVGLLSFSCSSSKSDSTAAPPGGGPVADFTGSPRTGDPSLTVNFTSTSTGTISSYSWDFGDSSYSTDTNPSHTYTTDGLYTVSLTVSGSGGSDTETKVGYITCGNPPGPAVGFEGSPLVGDAALTVSFTDTSVGTNVHTWSWQFGDGGTSTSQNPQHTYNDPGTYDVTLTATDDNGTKSLTKPSYVEATDPAASSIVPPLGGSSGGSGGGTGWGQINANGVSCYIIVPSSYNQAVPNPYLIVYSGTEGDQAMTMNILNFMGSVGLGNYIVTVLDGVNYYNNPNAGATVIDWVRTNYNIDNDKTCLLSESAGTGAGLLLGFNVRQSYFAAYWANDVNTNYTPQQTAAQLGFAPWGNAGPGGDYYDANIIVNGMSAAGYRLPADAPYSGSGSGVHGDPNQFVAALSFFPGKSRQ